MPKKHAFVKYTKKGALIPGSLVVTEAYPKETVNGVWEEVPMNLCCDFTTTTTTTFIPTTTTSTTTSTTTTSTTSTTSTTTSIPYYTFRLAYQSVLESACLLTPNQDYYSDSPYLFVGATPPDYIGSIVYTDTALTIPASNGYYHSTSNTWLGVPNVVWNVSDIAGNPGEVINGYTCPLILRFSDITAVDTVVGDSSNVADWNSYFDLPTYGTPFLSVAIVGNDVYLEGATNVIIKPSLFDQADQLGTFLLEIDDQAKCITEVRYDGFGYDINNGCYDLTYINLPKVTTAGNSAFYYAGAGAASVVVNLPLLATAGNNCFDSSGITTLSLPSLTTAGGSCFTSCYTLTSVNLPLLNIITGDDCFSICGALTTISLPSLTATQNGCFIACTSLTTISLPSCINLGTTVGDTGVFAAITGKTITLTVPTALMTCNGGLPDGDIQYLQANNTVTIVTV